MPGKYYPVSPYIRRVSSAHVPPHLLDRRIRSLEAMALRQCGHWITIPSEHFLQKCTLAMLTLRSDTTVTYANYLSQKWDGVKGKEKMGMN